MTERIHRIHHEEIAKQAGEIERLRGITVAVSCNEATVKDCERYCSHGEDKLHAEALRAELEEWRRDPLIANYMQCPNAEDHQAYRVLRNALRSIADNSCCESCQEARLVARTALMEISQGDPKKCWPAPAPVEKAGEDPLMGMDAQKWAQEFMRIWSGRWAEVDEGLMISWFANAIMRGYDEAWKRQQVVINATDGRTKAQSEQVTALRAEVERLRIERKDTK